MNYLMSFLMILLGVYQKEHKKFLILILKVSGYNMSLYIYNLKYINLKYINLKYINLKYINHNIIQHLYYYHGN